MSFENMFKLLKPTFIICFSTFIFSSCSSPQKNYEKEDTINQKSAINLSENTMGAVPESYKEDLEYFPIFSQWEREVNLYKNLELYFSGTVVLMTQEMQENYRKRVLKVQGEGAKLDTNIISDEKDILPVVISMYTSFSKFIELDNPKIWNVALNYHNKWYQPLLISYYRNRSSLQAYFPLGTAWSRAYVAQFRIPNFKENDKSKIIFTMRSGITKVNYIWR